MIRRNDQSTHTRTHARTDSRMHAHTRIHMHAGTHTRTLKRGSCLTGPTISMALEGKVLWRRGMFSVLLWSAGKQVRGAEEVKEADGGEMQVRLWVSGDRSFQASRVSIGLTSAHDECGPGCGAEYTRYHTSTFSFRILVVHSIAYFLCERERERVRPFIPP